MPTYVLDEEGVGGGGKTFVHGLRDAEMLYRTAPLLPCGVARSVAERRLTVVVHSRRDVALARQGGLDPDSIVLVVDAADSRSHSEVPPWPGGVGRIVVGAGVRIDTVAAPGPESGRQKTIVGVRDTCCAGATIRRVVDAPGLDLVGIRCDCVPTVGDIREQVLTAVAVMCDAYREHRVLCTELHLGIAGGATDIVGSSDLADAVADAVEDACIRNRFPRPRLSVDAGRSVTARAAVSVCRVHHVERTPGGPVVVLDSGAGSVVAVTTGELVAAAVANRPPFRTGGRILDHAVRQHARGTGPFWSGSGTGGQAWRRGGIGQSRRQRSGRLGRCRLRRPRPHARAHNRIVPVMSRASGPVGRMPPCLQAPDLVGRFRLSTGVPPRPVIEYWP